MTEHYILYGKTRIDFRVKRNQRSCMTLSVSPSFEVCVQAPLNCELEMIYKFVLKRASWIIDKINHYKSFSILPQSTYQSGESFYYLGKRLRLYVRNGDVSEVYTTKYRLVVKISPNDKVKNVLDRWYLCEAQRVFRECLTECMENVCKIGIQEEPILKVAVMKTRWGSCDKRGIIRLNPILVRALREEIKYVLFHELCHLLEHNHTQRFYKLLLKVMPEYKNIQSKLNKMPLEAI